MKTLMGRGAQTLLERPHKIFTTLLGKLRPHLTGALFADTLIAALSLPLSFLLRLGVHLGTYNWRFLLEETIGFTCIAVGVFVWTESHKGIWRYTSLSDLTRLFKTVFLCELFFLPFLFLNGHLWFFPITVFFIQPLVLGGFWGGSRVLYRLFSQRFEGEGGSEAPLRTLLVGTGSQTDLFLRELGRQKKPAYDILGILDSKSNQLKRHIHGLEILGHLNQLEEVVAYLSQKRSTPDLLIVADPQLRGKKLNAFSGRARQLGIEIGQLPQMTSVSSLSQKNWIKPLSIEDLLGRPQASLDRESMFKLVKGKKILITGVGGSIGGELVQQIADFSPAHMTLLDHSEYLLYQAALKLQERHPYLSRRLLLVDVRERDRIFQVMNEEKPDYVFHAAALKHVPLVESHILEGIFTNVLGTRHLADACVANRVLAMLLVSTDKAINPTSIMGTTKRLAESYCQALDVLPFKQNMTRFITVRFGNVLGSTGSVVPLFQRQIERGGPVTVTDPQMTRYFMTIQEAVGLILQATVLGAESEMQRGRIFVLDMGEPVSILELAENMIQLSGLVPHKDIKITFTGLRPGEKLNEELFHASEKLLKTPFPGILVASPQIMSHADLMAALEKLEEAVYQQEMLSCLALLKELVPEYQQTEEMGAHPLSYHLYPAPQPLSVLSPS